MAKDSKVTLTKLHSFQYTTNRINSRGAGTLILIDDIIVNDKKLYTIKGVSLW